MEKIHPKNYKFFKQKFYIFISNYPLINAVLSNLQKGFVYSNLEKDILIVITKSGFSLIEFINPNEKNNKIVFNFLLDNNTIPKYIHIYNINSQFLTYVKNNWSKYKIRKRVQYRYKNKSYANVLSLLPSGYSIKTIQEISDIKLDKLNLDLGNRYWNSMENFYKHSIGACIISDNNEVAAICYAAVLIDNVAEMDTLVLNKFRGNGFMKIVSLPFFNISKENNYTVHWDTFVDNIPSFVIGQKFQPNTSREYSLTSIFLETDIVL